MLSFRTHGKWILAGEHAVLRGGTALVFPVASRYLDFEFEPGAELKLDIQHKNTDLEMAFWGVLEKALQNLNLSRKDVAGTLTLKSNIPVGAGMGASATLCVSLAKWLTRLGHLEESKQYEFSKNLENLFHGESSGVDVAVALNHQALEFRKPDHMKSFSPAWEPKFYLSYCGKRGVTSDCIKRVQSLLETNPRLGEDIDERMQKAVGMAQEALMTQNHLPLLKDSIDLASDCFNSWGLISKTLQDHMSYLKDKGAIASKPTGSGDGGFVLSLWKNDPDPSLTEKTLIKA